VALVAFVQPDTPAFGLDRQQAEHIRVVGPLVAVWFVAFAWPLFVFTPDRPSSGLAIGAALRQGMRTMLATLAALHRQRGVLRFLLAHMLYADGLATLFAFGGIYAAGAFDMSISEVITFGVVLNLTAGIGAFAFAWVDDWLGSRRTAALALVGLILASIAAVSVQSRPWFWAAGAALGLFVGPVQAASRSFMARLSPQDRQAEFFGLFALSGKATAFIGPAMVAAATEAAGSQRTGLATVIGLFVAGLILLLTVQDPTRAVRTSIESGAGRQTASARRTI
jgi:UMF1 family MFS transporter